MASADNLPVNLDAERFVLGSILLDDVVFPEGVAIDFFSVERNRRIWRRMCDLRARDEHIDRLTVVEEIRKHGELEADTISYLVSLDDGMPQVPNVDSYVRILADKAARRRIIFACENLKGRCNVAGEDLGDIAAAGRELFATVGARQGVGYRSIEDLPLLADCGTGDIDYLRVPELPRGSVIALTGDSGCGKSTLATAWARDAWRKTGTPALVLDRENPHGVIVDRLARLSAEDGPGLRFWGGWLATEAPQPDDPIVTAWAKENKGLVVVDSFSAFMPGDQNDASEVRAFMHRARRLADIGATVLILHHSGKGESSADYRGSSDFKASLDQAFHVSSFGCDGRLDKMVLRPFKTRIGTASESTYEYADGQLLKCGSQETKQTLSEQLMALLAANPGITSRKFEDLAIGKGIGRDRARTFLNDGTLSGSVRRENGLKNAKRFFVVGHGQGVF